MIADRQKIAAVFDVGLRSFRNLTAMAVPADGVCNYYKYIAVLREKLDRAKLKAALKEQFKVSLAGEVYEAPIQQQPIFKHYATRPLPVSEDLCARHICLPVFSGMEVAQAEQVLAALAKLVG